MPAASTTRATAWRCRSCRRRCSSNSVRELVRADRDWIPASEDGSLYLRPFMFASEALPRHAAVDAVHLCRHRLFGRRLFQGRAERVALGDARIFRAAPGGTGAAKCGGNYAASLVAQAEAIRNGCDQVVFLDAAERRWVEELGGMNVFFVFDDGSIADAAARRHDPAGVTRDSMLTLARDMGLTVREEPYAIEQWKADAESGRLTEAFACGTAAVVTPIGSVKGRTASFTIGGQSTGPLTQRLRGAWSLSSAARRPTRTAGSSGFSNGARAPRRRSTG